MKIAVAMSGGVDSSLASVLLQRQGHEIIGLTAKILLCSEMDNSGPRFDVCCSPENIADAQALAREYHFRHYLLDVEEVFSREIIDPFCRLYLSGKTPSPCLVCNARIKFRKLMDTAHSLGCEKLATGHYARMGGGPPDPFYVSRGHDLDKDQSYFLAMLPQEILKDTLFPLGDFTKSEIRRMAANIGLRVANKPESQEICFVPDDDYPSYIERRTAQIPPPGDILDREGNILGRHRGIHRYTIGQRRGLGIAAPHPLYVVEIDAEHNILVAGPREDLFRKGFLARNLNFMKAQRLQGREVWVKIRSAQKGVPARLEETDSGLQVFFESPQTGVTPGQAAVFYDAGGDILAGGWIEKAI